MSEQPIRHIVCAVRSRPGGEASVRRAIDLALATGARLTFFQVLDPNFLKRVAVGRMTLRSVYRELGEMADFTMTILKNQATLRGVETVDAVVRQGKVRQELLRFVAETDPDVLVIGRPIPSPGPDVFDDKTLHDFVTELEQTGRLKVIFP